MADFTTPEDFEKYMALMEEQYKNGFISAKDYNDALKDAAVGIKGYTANLNSSMKALGTSFKDMGKAMYDGKQGAATYNSTLSSGADAVAAYAMKFGPAGVALGAFTKAVVGFVNAALKQSDALYDSYAKISRTGTVGSQAMGEVFSQMKAFGYTVEQLGDMGDLLARNSKSFGTFSKSALEGARQFGDVANSIQNSPIREQFFRLGMSVNDINDGIAGYVNQQGKLGQLQGKSTKELTEGSQEYIKQLDLLAKLTGMTRQEQEDAREQALQVEAFYAGLADLDPKAQEQAMQAYTQALAKGGPKFAAEMAANFNGVITGASDAFLSTGGKSMQFFGKDFFARGGTADQAMAGIAGSITPTMMEVAKGVNQLGGGFGLNLRTMNQLKGGIDPLAKITEKLAQEQKDQLAGVNPATKAQAGLRDSQIKTSQNMTEFVNLGVNPATRALEIFTDVVETLTSFLPGAGAAKAKREEAAARKAGKETVTTRSEAAYQTNADAMGHEMGGYGVGGAEAPEPAPSAPGASAKPIGQQDLKSMGLKIKEGDVQKEGSTVSPALIELAKKIQEGIPGFGYFSGFNDRYHQAKDDPSKHKEGMALDFTLGTAPTKEEGDKIASILKSMGASYVKDEYNGSSKNKTAGHMHAEVSAAHGAILSGPASGYKPNLTMHGTEAVVPLNTPAQQAASGMGTDNSMLSVQIDKLDELISVMKSQLGVSTRIMQSSV